MCVASHAPGVAKRGSLLGTEDQACVPERKVIMCGEKILNLGQCVEFYVGELNRTGHL